MPDGPSQLTDVIVIGTRAVPGAPRGGGPGGGGSVPETPIRTIDLDAPPIDPESVWTEETAEAENERQNNCAAHRFAEKTKAKGDRSKEVEHFSLTWKKDGNTVSSEPREDTGRYQDLPIGSAVTSSDFNRLAADYAVSPDSITAFNHSHAADTYCNGSGLMLVNQQNDNRYPSARDAVFANALIEADVSPAGLTLYVTDCEGNTRGFPYRQDGNYRSQALPPVITSDACESD